MRWNFDPARAGAPLQLEWEPPSREELLRSLSSQRMDGEPIFALAPPWMADADEHEERPERVYHRTCHEHGGHLVGVISPTGRETIWCESGGHGCRSWDVVSETGEVVAQGSFFGEGR